MVIKTLHWLLAKVIWVPKMPGLLMLEDLLLQENSLSDAHIGASIVLEGLDK